MLSGRSSKISLDIPPTPPQALRRIPPPKFYETWFDPSWTKYHGKLHNQHQQIVDHQGKVAGIVSVQPQLHEKMESLGDRLDTLSLRHFNYAERDEHESARDTCRVYAEGLQNYKSLHTQSTAYARRKLVSKKQAMNEALDTMESSQIAAAKERELPNNIYRQLAKSTPQLNQSPLAHHPIHTTNIPSSGLRVTSPTLPTAFQADKLLMIRSMLRLRDIAGWLENVTRLTCVHWLSDVTEWQSTVIMRHMVQLLTASSVPRAILRFPDLSAEGWDQQSTLVPFVAKEFRDTIEAFRMRWNDSGSSPLGQGINEQVKMLVINTFHDIPPEERKGVLFMVEGLDYCDEVALEIVFQCLEECARCLPVCFLISSKPSPAIETRVEKLRLVATIGIPARDIQAAPET